MQMFTHNFFNLVPNPQATGNNYQIFRQFYQNICLALFSQVFL